MPKPVFKSVILLLISVVILGSVVAFTRLSHRRVIPPAVVARRPAARPTATPTVIPVIPATILPNRATAIRKAVQCLTALCDNGASSAAISGAHALIAQSKATHQPYAAKLAALLEQILAYGNDNAPRGNLMNKALFFSEISSNLINRAAAACAARGSHKPDEIVLSFAGDCTFGTVNGDDSAIRFPYRYRRSGRADYPFALVRPWLLNDDLTVVNFECTLTDAIETANKEWKFKGPASYARIFPASSVDVAGISNNHSHDYLDAGFHDTVANLKKGRVPTFYQNMPYVTTIRGIETIIIGDCTVVGENTTVIGKAPQRVIQQINRYKKPGNIVVVVMHWGSELDTVPRPWQQALGHQFIDAGADAVVGHHPHVVQGIELYKGKYIAYSLGNFAFGGNSLARFPETFLLQLHFPVVNGEAGTQSASIVPCRVTSSTTRNDEGVLRNNYQPQPIFGPTARQTVDLILKRSARLSHGVKTLKYLQLP